MKSYEQLITTRKEIEQSPPQSLFYISIDGGEHRLMYKEEILLIIDLIFDKKQVDNY